MKVAVVGTGYVGLVTGAGFAELGHEVICHDIDEEKINGLRTGIIPIYEPGLDELVERNMREGRLSFTTGIKEAVEFGDIVMSAVGTPPDKDHKADLQYVKQVASSFAEHLNGYKVFVNKSTVPVGTAELCDGIITTVLKERGVDVEFDVVSNPEFLREGRAVNDIFNPDRIIVGVGNYKARELIERLYKPLVRTGRPLIFTSIKSAELIKYAANSFLATKISFINEMANFCEKVGADIKDVSKGIGLDSRISSKFLHAGIGYGGSCFPKDVKALVQIGDEIGSEFKILKAVDEVNEAQKLVLLEKFDAYFPEQEEVSVAVWGLAFKPKTDDLRFAPSVEVIKGLLKRGVKVKAFDPVAMENFKRQNMGIFANSNFNLVVRAFDALEDADCLMILTEWDEFRGVDLDKMAGLMKGNVLLDGRNIYEAKEAREVGFVYEGVGRSLERYSKRKKGEAALVDELLAAKDANVSNLEAEGRLKK